MPRLSETIAHLSRLRPMPGARPDFAGMGRLRELSSFGSNPGDLLARTYVPESLASNPALVVVLHGCTQSAAGYDIGSGWSERADRHGFALLFPEQQRSNNPNLCFSWFSPQDNRRGRGEALSIRQMVATMVERHGIDPARVFITGLSAGGAMTSVMLATYPEVFAGGAIIAGLPYGCANSIPEALQSMQAQDLPGERRLEALVRGASDCDGDWPTISVWHGSADAVVNPANADAIIDQWRALHGVGAKPSRTGLVNGYPRGVWTDDRGRDVIEEYRITGMGHGTPLATSGEEGCGRSGAHMLEAGISSTDHICRFWGLADSRVEHHRPSPPDDGPEFNPPEMLAGMRSRARPTKMAPGPHGATAGVGKIIEDALRAAGLMR